MTSVDVTAGQVAAERLEALAGELGKLGFAIHAVEDGGGLRLRVASRAVSRLSEDVYAARAGSGSWLFWWSWAEPIAGIDDVAAAAAMIARVLTPRHD